MSAQPTRCGRHLTYLLASCPACRETQTVRAIAERQVARWRPLLDRLAES